MSFGKTVTLSNGAKLPRIGLGTCMSTPKEAENAVEIAVRNGYRHFDCAMIYGNQDEIGRALKKVIPSVVKREELFITSKLWNDAHRPDQVEKQLDETLRKLGLDYIDLYLEYFLVASENPFNLSSRIVIHWPVAFPPGEGFLPPHSSIKGEIELDTETSLVDTWKAMIALPKSKVRSVGVSNFTVENIKGIVEATGVYPVANQFEAHPLLQQPELVKYCQQHNIHITGYSPLGNNSVGKPNLTENPVVIEIAKRLDATPAQVLIAWGTRHGHSVVPRSAQEARIISNFKEIEISDDDFARIAKLGEGDLRCRYNIPFCYKPVWSISVFKEDVEKNARAQVKIG